MAIVINGSGTVTGLAVGGLPDGTVAAGTLATDSVVTGKIADGTIANADINDLAASKLTGALPAISGASLTGITTGKVLQVKQLLLTTPSSQSLSANTNTVVSGSSLSITPTSTSSKILVTMQWNGECSVSPHALIFGLQVLIPFAAIFYPGMPSVQSAQRGGLATTLLSNPTDNASTMESASFSILYSPNSTESITHKVYCNHTGAVTLYNQRTKLDSNSPGYERITSTLQLMEIAG